ncbi:MAG: acylneuraminate cytidylyltransferase [Candidatus Marinimicrobia bacterium]|nr:acylneuraminate cytidylyltransferase [Candidatus Neomarinimicrobiota bacterium]|tara:strand:- start:371 stop:853 length:483 start_codon:yes stop_codon:yes gene_type:complete
MVNNNLNEIKLVLTDIDGVWTDSKFYYDENGFAFKSFSTYDGMGVELLKKKNIDTIIISSENCKAAEARAKKLKINQFFLGEKDKYQRAKSICKQFNLNLKNLAFIGDDINDLKLLKHVGFSAMPPNSPILNLFKPNYTTKRSGGNGAFREFADVIINNL